MSKVPDHNQHPQEHAVEIVAAVLDVLRTRDAFPLTEEQISERARNTVTALEGAFDLVPHQVAELVESLRGATAALRAAADDVRAVLATGKQR